MWPESVRLTQSVKEDLGRIKRSTGIKHWNTLCRWALCQSLRDSHQLVLLTAHDQEPSNVEIAWRVLGGPEHDAYRAALTMHAIANAIPLDDAAALINSHISRGVGRLRGEAQTLEDLFHPIAAASQLGVQSFG